MNALTQLIPPAPHEGGEVKKASLPSGKKLLTASRLKTARGCLRQHKLQYVEGYRPVEDAAALRFGTLVHKGLEAWWTHLDRGNALNVALSAMREEPSDPFDLARADAMVAGYHIRWGDEKLTVVAVEQEFQTPLIHPITGEVSSDWVLAGKIDAIVRDANGRTLVMEHKTSSEDVSAGAVYWSRLRLDGQLSMYYAGARALGYDVQGVIYDVLSKPGLRPLQINSKRAEPETADEYRERLIDAIGKEPSKFYSRGEIVRLDSEMRDAMLDMWEQGEIIRASLEAGISPRNPAQCFAYGRPCSFYEVCTGDAVITDPAKFKQSTNLHPELENK